MWAARYRLESGQRELARIRSQAGVSFIALGVLLAVAYELLYYFVEIRSIAINGYITKFWWSPWAYLYSTVAAVLYHSKLIVIALAPVAQSLSIMRLVIALDAAVACVGYWLYLIFVPVDFLGMQQVVIVRVVADTCFAICAACLCRDTDVVRMRARFWWLLGLWVGVCTVLVTFLSVALSIKNRKVSVKWAWVVVQLSTLALIARPTWRRKLRQALTSLIERRSSAQAAAGVAAFVGNCRPRDVLAQAAARFRSLPISQLEFKDMADNTPSPAIFGKTASCRLGRCDAFISHSWHDDAEAKWDALQRWRKTFIEEHGREPTVWIDKCCIDQHNIEQDLRCLPVFLSGCTRLVVCCGPSYLSRLWCVVELFSFVHMGGRTEAIDFVPVCRPGREAEDLAGIRTAFAGFAAHQCACTLPEDKARMLDVIAEAFGGLADFDRAVQDIFDGSSWRGKCSACPLGVECGGVLPACPAGRGDGGALAIRKEASWQHESTLSTSDCASEGGEGVGEQKEVPEEPNEKEGGAVGDTQNSKPAEEFDLERGAAPSAATVFWGGR